MEGRDDGILGWRGIPGAHDARAESCCAPACAPAASSRMVGALLGPSFAQAIALVFTILIPAGASKKIYETIPDNDDFDNTTSPVSKSKKASRALGTPGK